MSFPLKSKSYSYRQLEFEVKELNTADFPPFFYFLIQQ